MSGAADLLRAGGVVRAVLRLVGRHRLASVVAVVLAVGWLLVGAGADDRATRAVAYSGAFVSTWVHGIAVGRAGTLRLFAGADDGPEHGAESPDSDRDGDGDGDGGAGAGRHRADVHAGDAVRGGAVEGVPGVDRHDGRSDGGVPARAAGPLVRPVML